jgi:hypothetical protein
MSMHGNEPGPWRTLGESTRCHGAILDDRRTRSRDRLESLDTWRRAIAVLGVTNRPRLCIAPQRS